MTDLPTFIICGAQKGGTTALYQYLKENPKIAMSKKEVHYFDLNYHRGIEWYKKHFEEFQNEKNKSIGEATPSYTYFEKVPERIHMLIPEVKLIFILRNPVDRAYSHYWHSVRHGYEYLSFEEAIKKEEERLLDGDISIRQHYSYKDRGKYAIQLKRFRKYFSKEQILILLTEELKEKPEKVMKKIFDFLELGTEFISPTWHIQHYKGKQPRIWRLHRLIGKLPNNLIGNGIRYINYKVNLKDGYPPINSDTKQKLISYFKLYNKELEKFLGEKLIYWHE